MISDMAPSARFRDLAGAAPRITLPFKTNLGNDSKLSLTPEGFLLCREVALARTGTQIYLGWEVPDVEPGPDGTVVIERDAEDVFSPEAIASFAGKPFTDEHPTEDVSPANFVEHLKGVIQNPRRGDGDRANLLLGDVIIYAQPIIDKILGGKREVSCGYSVDYQKIEPGRGKQTAIRGNHVSLVEQGRCGPTCAILDHAATLENVMTQVARDARTARDGKARDKAGIFGRLRDAMKNAKDEDAIEAAIAAAEADAPEAGDGSTVVVNVTQAAPDDKPPLDPATVVAMKTDPPVIDKARDEDAPDMAEAVKAALAEAMAPVLARLDALEGRADETAENVEAIAEETGMDVETTQDAMSRAEILAPGIAFPARDAAARPGSRAARDHAVGIMRKGLTEGLKTAEGASAIRAVLPGITDYSKLSAGEVSIAFRAASDRVRDANNAKRGAGLPHAAIARDGVNPLAAINERNRAARAALTAK